MRRAHPRLVLLSALTLSGIAAPKPVQAQPAPAPASAPSQDVTKRAEALFRNANQLYADQKWAEAEAGFLAAWALNPTYDVAANLGHTQFKLQKYRDAAEHLAFALRNWPLIGKPEPRKLAQNRLDEVRQLLATVTVRVNEPSAKVFVDGQLVGQSPIAFEVFVDPGSHVFEAKLVGHGDAREVVQAVKGSAPVVSLELSAPSTVPGGGTPPVVARGPSKAVLIAGGAVAGAGVVLGAVLAGVSNSKASSLRSQQTSFMTAGTPAMCGVGSQATPACAELTDTLNAKRTTANASFWSFVGGGAVGAATLIYWVATPKSTSQATPDVRVVPSAGPQGGGLEIRGTW